MDYAMECMKAVIATTAREETRRASISPTHRWTHWEENMEGENGEAKEVESMEAKERVNIGEEKVESMEEKVCGRVYLEEEEKEKERKALEEASKSTMEAEEKRAKGKEEKEVSATIAASRDI